MKNLTVSMLNIVAAVAITVALAQLIH